MLLKQLSTCGLCDCHERDIGANYRVSCVSIHICHSRDLHAGLTHPYGFFWSLAADYCGCLSSGILWRLPCSCNCKWRQWHVQQNRDLDRIFTSLRVGWPTPQVYFCPWQGLRVVQRATRRRPEKRSKQHFGPLSAIVLHKIHQIPFLRLCLHDFAMVSFKAR